MFHTGDIPCLVEINMLPKGNSHGPLEPILNPLICLSYLKGFKIGFLLFLGVQKDPIGSKD